MLPSGSGALSRPPQTGQQQPQTGQGAKPMRKITRESAQALLNGETYRKDNTHVEGGIMTLHGNTIAYYDGNTLMIRNAGWHTTTTKERLNGVLSTFGNPHRVFTKSHTPMISRRWLDDRGLHCYESEEWSGEWTVVQ